MKEAKKRALEYMGILSSFSLFCWASMDEYWSSNKYMSYVDKSRGKCGEFLVSSNIIFFFPSGEEVCYMFISFYSPLHRL